MNKTTKIIIAVAAVVVVAVVAGILLFGPGSKEKLDRNKIIKKYAEYLAEREAFPDMSLGILLDEDDIPESYITYEGDFADSYILAYKNDKIQEYRVDKENTKYIPNSGYFMTTFVGSGGYTEYVVRLTENGFEEVSVLNYQEDLDKPIFDDDGNYIAEHKATINGVEGTYEECLKTFKSIVPVDFATAVSLP